MPAFTYIARDAAGEQKTGVLQAESEAAVVRLLSENSLYPVRIEAAAAPGPARRFGRGGIRLRELGATYSQLADLLAAGVPMLRSLDILQRVAVNARLRQVLADVRELVAAGETLSDAMSKNPAVFAALHVAMVRAGEHAGFLESVLTNLATFIERQDELRSKVRGAMIYPALLATFGVVVVSIILVVLVPQFKQFLANRALPLPTVMLFAVSDALREHALVVLAVLAAVVLAVRGYVHSARGQKLWDHWKLRLPLAGGAIRMVAITRFCRVLGTMLANGVPIIQALLISKDATGNRTLSEAIEQAAENIRGGDPLAEPLRRCGLIPEEIIEMIAVGEESNQLEKVLVQVADTVERRTNRQVDAAVRLVEPLMLMFMAGCVGFIALALLYPIFTMASNLGK